MAQDTPSFFTLDRGSVSTSASLIAPVDGRYRLLASATAPRGVEAEAILEDLAWRVARTDAALSGSLEGWQTWSRLEVRTTPAPRACLVAASAETGELLERAFSGAGWHVAFRSFEPRPDIVALGQASLNPDVDAIVVGGREVTDDIEREHIRLLWPLAGSLARFRDDLAVIACGPFRERPEGIGDDRLFSLPAPDPVPATAPSELRQAASQVGFHLRTQGEAGGAEGRGSLRTTIASLAVLLGNRVEGVEIGAAAGSRTLAHPDAEVRHAVLSTAALLPGSIIDDDAVSESILRWSTGGGDAAGNADRLRELCLRPWSGIDRTSAHLRLAALRAALERMQQAWDAAHHDGRAEEDAADVLVLSGGGFDSVPSAAAALAVVDSIRRPGAATILHDHARVLAPLGALPVEGDRRRLLADLVDDVLLPIGSVLLTGALGERGTGRGTMSISTSLGSDELDLEPGDLRLVDLPPGIVARLDIDPLDGSIMGVTGRRIALEVSGGLGGLLVDTRDIPLRLPDSPDRRRALLEGWEEPAWIASER